MKQFYLPIIGAAAIIVGLTGCIDDKYDIGDANTLTRIPVNNLTIPLNLDKVYLDSIVDLTDGTNVEKYKDPVTGEEYYALTEKGDIDSDDISIDPIHIGKAHIESADVPLHTGTSRSGVRRAPSGSVPVGLVQKLTPFTYTANDIDKAVKSIEGIWTKHEVQIKMTLSLPSSLSISSAAVENLKLQFPKGLYDSEGKPAKANVGVYDPETGILNVASHTFASSHKTDFIVTCNIVEIPLEERIPTLDRKLIFSGEMGIVDGEGCLYLTVNNGSSLPASFTLHADYDLPQFDVKSFTGDIDYTVENTSIDPISLKDLPDFLQDPKTNIILADPQFYFSINNPAANYGTIGKGHLDMTSNFHNDEDIELKDSYSSSSGTFYIEQVNSNNIALSPNGEIEVPLEEYNIDLQQYTYPEMKYLLSGAPDSEHVGLPSTIEVSFSNPTLEGNAQQFPVGEVIGKIGGTYEFFAPLAFDEGSVIVYEENSEVGGDTMDDIYVKLLKITAECDSSFPVDVKLSATVYNENDEILGYSNEQVIPALTQCPISLEVKPGEGKEEMNIIHHIKFRAVINQTGTGEGTALAPDQGLILSTLRFNVDGYFQKKL